MNEKINQEIKTQFDDYDNIEIEDEQSFESNLISDKRLMKIARTPGLESQFNYFKTKSRK